MAIFYACGFLSLSEREHRVRERRAWHDLAIGRAIAI